MRALPPARLARLAPHGRHTRLSPKLHSHRLAVALLTVGLLLAAGVGVAGQSYEDEFENPYLGQPLSLSLSAFGGAYWSSPWNDLVLVGSITSLGGVEQVLLQQVQVNPGALVGASVTYRRGRGGARLQFAYSHSCLALSGSCNPADYGDGTQIPLPTRIELNTWMADVEAEVTLIPVHRGQWARPYWLVGAGAVVYAPQGTAAQLLPQFLAYPGGIAHTEGELVVVDFPGTGQLVADVEGAGLQTVFAVVLGVGTDLRIPIDGGGFGIRLQVADHIAASPMHAKVMQHDRIVRMNFGAIHNIRLTAGVVVDFDLGTVKRKVAARDR